ncbi:guanylate kinase [Buchnera aphidicola (Thelaxes californica)]|uniref:Guanylate kinase n=1 Tax=Buchnera aphidicola (Thelaxes californica) TaxID=1315998 RepID=A0A4D6YAU4_9GAMM|nr:guanylate kinase [Buchnera aphidicola]QCI26997.1 guanylate kinase [Buchnera aphidicola (Thelaxes californica)]
MKSGICFIISAPSGAGKSSLIRSFLSTKYGLNSTVSVSYTTRKIRNGEKEGKHYYFISKKKFENMIKKNLFLEYATVFNHYYGTSRVLTETVLKQGKDVFLDIDWQGAQQVRNIFSPVVSIFIFPPSKKELYQRLKKRGQNTTIDIENRMKKSVLEMNHYNEYDYIIINDDFYQAISDLKSIVISYRLSLHYQQWKKYHFIQSLICK